MFAASLMMASDRVYQPKTPVKSKWEYINELLTLHRGRSYPWDDPNYVEKVYQPTTPKKNKWEYINEILTLHSGMSYPWDRPNQGSSFEMNAYVDYGETTTFLVNHQDEMADSDVNTTDFDGQSQNNFEEVIG